MALGFLAAADPQIAKAEAWARARLDRAFTVDDVARAAGLAPRTFARRTESATGQSPVRFLQRLRVDAAIELIETTRLPFEEIARRVGYAEPSTLRRLLQRTAGQGPRGLRNGSAERQINGKKPTKGAILESWHHVMGVQVARDEAAPEGPCASERAAVTGRPQSYPPARCADGALSLASSAATPPKAV
jgi:AraC-like DNA-binding protein